MLCLMRGGWFSRFANEPNSETKWRGLPLSKTEGLWSEICKYIKYEVLPISEIDGIVKIRSAVRVSWRVLFWGNAPKSGRGGSFRVQANLHSTRLPILEIQGTTILHIWSCYSRSVQFQTWQSLRKVQLTGQMPINGQNLEAIYLVH